MAYLKNFQAFNKAKSYFSKIIQTASSPDKVFIKGEDHDGENLIVECDIKTLKVVESRLPEHLMYKLWMGVLRECRHRPGG